MPEPLVVTLQALAPVWTGDANRKGSHIREMGVLDSLRWRYEKDWSQKQIVQDLETMAAVLKAMFLEYGFSAKKTAGWVVTEDAVTDGRPWARGLMWPPLTEDTIVGRAPSFQEPRSEYVALMNEAGKCRRARTSGALRENGADCCAHMMRMTRGAYLRTAAFCLRTSHPT